MVLRQNIAQERYGKSYSPLYIALVFKWRCHFYNIILKVFGNAKEIDFPILFTPLEQYVEGFTVEYGDINALPPDIIPERHEKNEVGEGCHFIGKDTIYIFYDQSPSISPQRQRFTIAHEWGHIFQRLDWDFKSDMEGVADPEERDAIIESVAHHFANNYLVPFPLFQSQYLKHRKNLCKEPTPYALAQCFNVSESMMKICFEKHKDKIKQ